MTTVAYSVVLDLNLELTVRTLNIFDTTVCTMYLQAFIPLTNIILSNRFHVREKLIHPFILSQMLFTLLHKYFASNCACKIPTK